MNKIMEIRLGAMDAIAGTLAQDHHTELARAARSFKEHYEVMAAERDLLLSCSRELMEVLDKSPLLDHGKPESPNSVMGAMRRAIKAVES